MGLSSWQPTGLMQSERDYNVTTCLSYSLEAVVAGVSRLPLPLPAFIPAPTLGVRTMHWEGATLPMWHRRVLRDGLGARLPLLHVQQRELGCMYSREGLGCAHAEEELSYMCSGVGSRGWRPQCVAHRCAEEKHKS